MHPSEGIRSVKGRELEGKRIILGITGSIAAVECFKLARELIRHGGDVQAVMSPEAVKLVTTEAMQFATGKEVITDLDGRVQHIDLLGDYEDRADLLLVAPCTANTLSKMALAIDDTAVTTMATVAIGANIPVLVAPAMHLAMFNHPGVQRNVKTLREMGVGLIGPTMIGKKAHVASIDEIVQNVLRRLGPGDLRGKKVLIIGGSSEEPIDQVRVITNRSSGETAICLAQTAFRRGAEVELWTGRMSVPVPGYFKCRSFRRVEELLGMVDEIDHDAVIVPAALSDYAPISTPGKIPSGSKTIALKLTGLPKVLPAIRPRTRVLIGFKAEIGVSSEELIGRARARLEEYDLDLIAANDLSDVKEGATRTRLVRPDGEMEPFEGSKMELAERLMDEVQRAL